MTARRRLRVIVATLCVILPLWVAPGAANAVVVPSIVAVAAGGNDFACALTSRGGVKCWGDNQVGQLGDGSTTSRLYPVDVSGLASGVTAIAAGSSHTCALTTRGGVVCWGNNYNGLLGDGTFINSAVPVDVVGLTGVTAIAAGFYQTCALTGVGAVWCWGLDFGPTGGPLTGKPAAAPGLQGSIVAITVGTTHSCALSVAGGVQCWGLNDYGQLGAPTASMFNVITSVTGLRSEVVAIATGDRHSCAVKTSGAVLCWGANGYGQLGDGTRTNRALPVPVTGLAPEVVALAAGYRHTCAVGRAGALTCWGQNAYGQLGDGTTSAVSVPVRVSGLPGGVRGVTAGQRQTCAVRTDGTAWCWGGNTRGQLGNGSRTNSKVPVKVDFAPHYALVLDASRPAGTLAAGTAVTFTAAVTAPAAGGPRAIVRFEIHRRIDGVWRRAAHRDVTVDARGQAPLRWTFATRGSRFVRAIALADAATEPSAWSPRVYYGVR